MKFTQPKTYDDLKEYAYFVAGSVGLMLLPILSQHSNEIKFPAKQLGEAMQVTNILRDIGEDLNMNRIYLPKEMMVRYEVTEEVLKTMFQLKILLNYGKILQIRQKNYTNPQ